MQKYEAIQKLSPTEFRRLTGVRKETFVQMISIVKEAEKQRMSQGGKPSRLVVEDRAYLSDQLQRAGLSIPLNIAEGAGEYSIDEKARFYRMAKRSATECAGILDVCQRLQLVNEERYTKGRELQISIVSMLVKIAQKQR